MSLHHNPSIGIGNTGGVPDPPARPASPTPARPWYEVYPGGPPDPPPPGPPAGQVPPAAGGAGPPRPRGQLLIAAAIVLLLVATTAGLLGGWVGSRLADDSGAVAGTGPVTGQAGEASLTNVVTAVQPSVVSVQTGLGEGSGVILDAEGHVLTNAHVVAGAEEDSLQVTLSDGEAESATVVGADERSDLAVLRLAESAGLPAASFGDSDAVQVGDAVLALGSPLGLEGSVSSGIVSAKNRTVQVGQQDPGLPGQPGEAPGGGAAPLSEMIQTDAPINPGNSGGALVDLNGNVVGINTAIATAGGMGSVGVGFAIPANTAVDVAEQLIAGEQVEHPYLGVAAADAPEGALVQSVAEDGPAEEAGLRTGDVITEVGTESVRSVDELVAAVQRSEVGAELPVNYLRDGAAAETTVTIGDAPTDP
ncbi:trypsin-like peptidase domain-containing protein [Natronosporangium hydrolyticum]|uniref:Trypsin-like peptidase domain-containing protein n=1 Tax=Natronosporangium hydrolyticum TaxID=2811111 RepID=A0A895YI43_9ACTN|nr:trypsin-like peptidase domain-containing protein [Natronosporangium hydrolyticum]QSB13810.1 trypsin-like peptidase domain-containing protein [Natronosporangium hydrolyticum]